MDAGKYRSSRRTFFLAGGATISAGVPGANASAMPHASSPEHEAIRRLHVTFTGRMESHAYEAAAELFAEDAHLQLSGIEAQGSAAILRLLTEQYRQQLVAILHSAYRPNALQEHDDLTFSDDDHARALWHVDVRLSRPLQVDCTIAQMARLQGQMAEVRWESGELEASYVKQGGLWKMASLLHRAT